MPRRIRSLCLGGGKNGDGDWDGRRRHRTLTSLLDEATTLMPCSTYDRLEFLGDRVLEHFVSVSVMARNPALRWDADRMGDIRSDAVRNRALFEAALRVGMAGIVRAGPIAGGRMRGGGDEDLSDDAVLASVLLDYSPRHCPSVEIADGPLSDITEAVLAAAFLGGGGTAPSGAGKVIALLEILDLPLPEDREEVPGAAEGRPWFRALGPCLEEGYPFNLDRPWNHQLVEVGTTLYMESGVVDRLLEGYKGLVAKVVTAGSESKTEAARALLGLQSNKILLFSALFDDSLLDCDGNASSLSSRRSMSSLNSSFGQDAEVETASVASSTVSLTGLERVAALREVLHFVGSSALNFAISCELYHRYPDATAGDLHQIFTCAMSDDVLAYVTVKNGIHNFLYDRDAEEVKKFHVEMVIADAAGSEVWEKNGGWMLRGGIDEFQQRCQLVGGRPGHRNLREIRPRYIGLAGRRLRGHRKKLPVELTEDLAFSAKAIAGALTLSLGLEGMWQCLGPLFEENMLLSAEELRIHFGDISSICSTYQKGHESTLVKRFRQGWLKKRSDRTSI